MNWRRKSACFIVAVLTSRLVCAAILDGPDGPSPSGVQPANPASPGTLVSAVAGDYLIGPDDVLAVNVWKQPEISRTVPVRLDGKISLPLIGDIKASGRTAVQLQSDIKEQLRKYLSSPEAAVIVQEPKSHKFNIVGEVTRPGSYIMTNRMTVLDAIAMAGGFRDFAKKTKIYVLRTNRDGSLARLPFNYKKLVAGDISEKVVLESRDTIIVP